MCVVEGKDLHYCASCTAAGSCCANTNTLLPRSPPPCYFHIHAHTALKIWVFSGDVDGIVPVLGSRRWIESLHLPVAKPWRAWTSRTGQVKNGF